MPERNALYLDDSNNAVIKEVEANDYDGLASVRTVRVRVKNTTGAAIPAGTPVTGTASGDGTFFFIEPATGLSKDYLGVTKELIGINAEGEVVLLGYVAYDTSAFAPGNKLYLNYLGTVVTTKPVEDHIYLGICVNSLVAGVLHIPRDAGWYQGDFFFYEEDEGFTSDNQTPPPWVTKLDMNIPAVPNGDWLLGWSYQWNHNSTNTDFLGQVLRDPLGIAEVYFDHQQEPKDAAGVGPGGTNQKYGQSGFKLLQGYSGGDLFRIHFGSSGSADSTIWNARFSLELKRRL